MVKLRVNIGGSVKSFQKAEDLDFVAVKGLDILEDGVEVIDELETVESGAEVVEGVDSDNMDNLSLITYALAAFAGLVLLLCAIVALLLLFLYIRKSKRWSRRYEPVAVLENGVIPKRFNNTIEEDHDRHDGPNPCHMLLDEKQANGDTLKKDSKKRTPVKMRLFKRSNSTKRPTSKLEFDAEDFDVSVQKVPRVKKTVIFEMKSKSDWNINDFKFRDNREEIEVLLNRNSKDMSIRSRLSDQVAADAAKSQYFDAQEMLTDEEDEDDNVDYWEDIESDDEDTLEIVKTKLERRDRARVIPIKSQPLIIQRRIKALKSILYEQKLVESNFFKDVHRLEGRYNHLNRDPVYFARRKLIEGQETGGTIVEEDEDGGDAESIHSRKSNEGEPGIPGFWMRVFLNSKNLKQIVQATDIPLLTALVDIRIINIDDPLGFRLIFAFKPNDYILDKELTKDYTLICDPGQQDDLMQFEGPEVVACHGCKIHWKKNMNLCVRPVKKVVNHRIVTKWARKNSFFNFFNPPQLSSPNDVHHLKRQELLEAHFELGLFFKEQIIPKAYLFFTRSGVDGSPKTDTPRKSSADALKKVQFRSNTKSSANTPIKRKKSDEKDIEPAETIIINNTDEKVIDEQVIVDTNDQENCKQENTEIVELPNGSINDSIGNESVKEIDTFPGTFLMESSDKFDEFLKALGVGMVRRKLANSVVPTNVNEITEDGEYILKTITTIRSTELRFRLNEPFYEDTLDGRKTLTTPTRRGNLLHLDQKAQNKGEKDTVMTREVDGDTMIVKCIVDDVVSTRIYKRIVQ